MAEPTDTPDSPVPTPVEANIPLLDFPDVRSPRLPATIGRPPFLRHCWTPIVRAFEHLIGGQLASLECVSSCVFNGVSGGFMAPRFSKVSSKPFPSPPNLRPAGYNPRPV
jgi:hypothetical protein